jgi:hypothetical protein
MNPVTSSGTIHGGTKKVRTASCAEEAVCKSFHQIVGCAYLAVDPAKIDPLTFIPRIRADSNVLKHKICEIAHALAPIYQPWCTVPSRRCRATTLICRPWRARPLSSTRWRTRRVRPLAGRRRRSSTCHNAPDSLNRNPYCPGRPTRCACCFGRPFRAGRTVARPP